MTTIAWDGETLAADRQGTYASTKHRVRKLFDCGAYVYGASGDWYLAHLVAEWLAAGADPEKRVKQREPGCCGIAVRKSSGRVFAVQGETVMLTRVRDRFHASGSGHEYARAAMALGKSAAEAVRFAARFDTFTGLGVDVMHVRRRR